MTGAALTHELAALAGHVLDAQVRLPRALLGAPESVHQLPPAGEQALQTAIAVGGALLLAYAAWAHAAHRATATQVRELARAGAGFLLCAFASASLHDRGLAGPAVSLFGAVLVLRASRALVRERLESRNLPNERPPAP